MEALFCSGRGGARRLEATHRQISVLRALSEGRVLLAEVLVHLRQQQQPMTAVLDPRVKLLVLT